MKKSGWFISIFVFQLLSLVALGSERPASIQSSDSIKSATEALQALELVNLGGDFNFNEYYMVRESSQSGQIDLLDMRHVQQNFPQPAVPYRRDQHFGGWLRDSQDDSCLNTRGKVLVRDSLEDVTMTASGCTVATGLWDDPYTARSFKYAQDIQIDHLVALKNAYMSGAHQWDFKKRCLYANYTGNDFHLLSVYGRENLKKSDDAPQKYIPPNRAYVCDYLKQWLFVKLIWSLRMTPPEVDAIQNIADREGCDADDFVIAQAELRQQRRYIQANANLCDNSRAQFEKF